MQRGQMELLLIGIIALAAFLLIGGFSTDRLSDTTSSAKPSFQCCDSTDCLPNASLPTVSFNGETYARLKTGADFAQLKDPARADVREHIHENQLGARTADGKKIFVNTSNQQNDCGSNNQIDQLRRFPDNCVGIDNDILIYVCRENCDGPSENGLYDVYFSISRSAAKQTEAINTIKQSCKLLPPSNETTTGYILEPPPVANSKNTLQLDALTFKQVENAIWLSPYCKPAIYLYPETKTDVNVSIKPQGKLTLTIPRYPPNGWSVLANPNGQINYQDKTFDYLYYEAEIPDNLIEEPKEGFMVKQTDLKQLFADLLPKLGLNQKESSQFSDYWLKALPKSPYYFVGIVSTNNLNKIAPITINPSPNTIIRVTLYFKALEEKITVPEPTINPVSRSGFTAVEWGGIVKTDPSHPFSCLM